ncbi:hypothetical protein AZE42_03202 [Rhizopogon vesiculosus]|uniref:Uncharacterized protein n=1 Tax=Rhizopogon vesiculosus TaxID=180088 RepID=A0A1J8R6J7_9AGAM|nr:hypothetical protein AZE42_03202 [Rhizopogon vesiculosus]
MKFPKMPSRRSSTQSELDSGVGRSTSAPPAVKECFPECIQLADGRIAERVLCPRRSWNRVIQFHYNGHPGIPVGDVFHGKQVQDSQETVGMAGLSTISLQWPGYDSPEMCDVGRVTVSSKTIQDLAVELCTALHSFYTRASKITPSVEDVPWALFSQVSLKDIVLASIHFDAGVWVPNFYVLRM